MHENQKCNEKHCKNIVTFLYFSLHFLFSLHVKKKNIETQNNKKNKRKEKINKTTTVFYVLMCLVVVL